MAAPADVSVKATQFSTSDMANLITEHNKLVVQFRALMAKLDANHGAASDHVSTISDAPNGPAKIVTV